MVEKRLRIGDLLLQEKLITEGQLELALDEQRSSGGKLGQLAVNLGFVSEERLLQVVSQQLDIPFVDLTQYRYEKEVVALLPEAQAKRLRAVPIGRDEDHLIVSMEDPTDILAIDELNRLLHQPMKLALAREKDLDKFFDVAYRRTEQISNLASELQTQLSETADFGIELNISGSNDEIDAPVVRLLQSIFEDAVRANASDIHIEPDEDIIRIRQRVDGVLQEYIVKEKAISAALVMRLKIIADMNISEKRLPQDGRFNIVVQGRNIDVRISTLPIQWGESIVMRLLDHSIGIRSLESLGMPEAMYQRYSTLIEKPHGMVLVTGPTGSGKTTTLYATLNELNQEGTKIITAEDPVEYRLPRVNQVQINSKIELTFARVLRAALRQDPDIVLVGEMRDSETAQIGLRAAMTGHLVFSTLHTNDAVSTALRLIDMGAEPYLVASALLGIVAQRLIRRNCDSCQKPVTIADQERRWIKSCLGSSYDAEAEYTFRKGQGCNNCNYTGYQGRIGVYELLVMDEALVVALQNGDHEGFYKAAHAQEGYTTLGNTALQYALQGVTTVSEAMRVSHGMEAG